MIELSLSAFLVALIGLRCVHINGKTSDSDLVCSGLPQAVCKQIVAVGAFNCSGGSHRNWVCPHKWESFGVRCVSVLGVVVLGCDKGGGRGGPIFLVALIELGRVHGKASGFVQCSVVGSFLVALIEFGRVHTDGKASEFVQCSVVGSFLVALIEFGRVHTAGKASEFVTRSVS